ncbi:hypothetical protein Taro_017003 [Colocasia esculenta]|uniref:Inositol oxygenase n=1 Tax=Colocasia esculenta TaxID=4460 RepID=A0A843UF76_COLES|nr:hypothetical protein [Colocasia esculenta]
MWVFLPTRQKVHLTASKIGRSEINAVSRARGGSERTCEQTLLNWTVHLITLSIYLSIFLISLPCPNAAALSAWSATLGRAATRCRLRRRDVTKTGQGRALWSVVAAQTSQAGDPPVLPQNSTSRDESSVEDVGSFKLDGGFVVPDSNTFGHSFRDYDKESERKASVEEFYRINHINQTYEFHLSFRCPQLWACGWWWGGVGWSSAHKTKKAKKKKEQYLKLDRAVMSIWECCELLNEFVDESDPDLDEPQIEHLLQTAEAIRRDYPDEEWLHLTALIHDLGKVLLHPSFGGEPQWCVVGDTYPLGCAFDESVVHYQYFKENPDYHNPAFNTKLGVYEENCGLDNVVMSWGHDEYMYLVMKENKTTLPPAAAFIIRFHSFYALHRSGAYTFLMDENDSEMLKWLHIFNKYDLYSKSKVRINQEEVKPYYMTLVQKYFPEKLRW